MALPGYVPVFVKKQNDLSFILIPLFANERSFIVTDDDPDRRVALIGDDE